MKILHILIDIRSAWGGPVRSVRELARLQRSLGFDVTVLSVERGGVPENFEGSSVVIFPPSFPARFGNSNGAIAWLYENAQRFDLVIVSEIWSVMIQRAMRTLRRLNVPYVIQPRGSLDPYDLKKKGLLKRILGPLVIKRNLESSRYILTASPAEEERLETFGAQVTRRTLPHPVRANQPGDANRLRTEIGISSETLIFLFLSRVDPKKRIDLLLTAFGSAAKHLPPSKLLIVGDGDPRLLKQLKHQAQSLSCAADVIFIGFQTGQRKSDLLAAADIFVLPSDFENFGIAVVEALHAGLPVVLSTGVQLWEGVVKAGAGMAFTKKAEDLSDLLVRLGTDTSLRSAMSHAAASYAMCFTPDQLSADYAAFWHSSVKTATAIESAAQSN